MDGKSPKTRTCVEEAEIICAHRVPSGLRPLVGDGLSRRFTAHNGKVAGASQRNDVGHCTTDWEGLVEPLRDTACIQTVPTGSPHAPLGTKQEVQHARHDGVVSVQAQEARDWRAAVIVHVSEHRTNRPTSRAMELGHRDRSPAGFGDETSPNQHLLDAPGLLNGDRQRRGAHIRD